MPNIVYAGCEDEKLAQGVLFQRGLATEVSHEVAANLCQAKPRIFFYEKEVAASLPSHLEAEYLAYPDKLIEHHTEHRRQYQRVADSYTDIDPPAEGEKPGKQYEAWQGAMSEVEWAEARIDEAKALKAERLAKAKGAKAKVPA